MNEISALMEAESIPPLEKQYFLDCSPRLQTILSEQRFTLSDMVSAKWLIEDEQSSTRERDEIVLTDWIYGFDTEMRDSIELVDGDEER